MHSRVGRHYDTIEVSLLIIDVTSIVGVTILFGTAILVSMAAVSRYCSDT